MISVALHRVGTTRTHFDNIQLENHLDSHPDLGLNPVHLEAVALEDNFGTTGVGDV